MDIHGILELLRQSLDFELVLSQLPVQSVDLVLQVRDRVGLILVVLDFVDKLSYQTFLFADLVYSLLVLIFALSQS